MNIGIKCFHGDNNDISSGNKLTSDINVAVCTIEKANSIFNQLLQDGNESQLSMVVVDEIHLLSDHSRGYLIEILWLSYIVSTLCFRAFDNIACA